MTLPRTTIWLSLLLAAPSACFDDRVVPEPPAMCRQLMQLCGDPSIWDIGGPWLRECYELGRAGVRDSSREDQCYAFYDECYNECEYYSFWYGSTAEADAALPDSSAPAPRDAASD